MALKELIKRIDELQAQIEAHGKLDNETLKKINYKFRLDWNYNSNVMEGNSLTKLETRSVMINNITVEGKPLKDVLEMRGHDEVITNILKIGKAELNLSEKRILEIHKGIMYEDDPEKKKEIGVWKKDNNYLYNYKSERVDFTPYTEVKEKMHELINWLNTQKEKIEAKDKKALHPAVLAFEFHLRYVSIHPFYDGNGRTARIFTNLILIAYGYPPVIIKLNEKDKYYQYLGDIQAYGGDSNLFYEFMGGLLIHSQELVLKAIEVGDIEEPDDFDKEVLLLTKSVEEHKDIVKIKKTKEIQNILYQNFFVPFIERLDEKFKKLNHLFFNNYYEADNNLADYPIIRPRLNRGYPLGTLAKYVLENDFNKFEINHVFEEFKRETNPFDVNTLISLSMDTLRYQIKITIGDIEDINIFFRAIDRMVEKDRKIAPEYYEYTLYENYFHKVPSKETVEKLADKVAKDTLAYIESQASKNKV